MFHSGLTLQRTAAQQSCRMPPQINRLSPLRTFTVLVFHLLLTHFCRGESQVIGPSQPIVASIGADIILPCHVEPAMDATAEILEWMRSDLNPRFVHVWRSGQDLVNVRHPSFRGRTSVFTNELKHGNISVKLSKVELSDEGTYECYVPSLDKQSFVKLVVVSRVVSQPVIKEGVVLQCKSEGWFPEPEVLWLDGEGNLLSAGPTETVRGPDDLYTVSSRVTVEKRHSNDFICRVQIKKIHLSRQTTVHVSADLFIYSNLPVRITVTMAVCVLFVAVVAFIVWKAKTKRQKEDGTEQGQRKMWTIGNNAELELLMEGQRDREQSMLGSEKMKYLKMKKAQFDEDLKKNEEELEHVQQVIEVCKKQKEDLKNQKEKLLSLQQEEKMKIKEMEKKQEEKTWTDKEKKQKKREKANEDAAKINFEHEELLKNTEKLLETTEEMIVRMTERKGKVETIKEQLLKVLQNTEQEIEELQRELEESGRKEDKDNPPHKQSTEHLQERTQVEEENNP